MSRIHATTNFRDSNGVDLGKKLITKDYLISVYPSIAQELGKTPELWTWGYGATGLGNNSTTPTSTPVTTFAGGTNWKQVSIGVYYTTAIKTDGTIWLWGSIPTTFAAGNDWKQVSSPALNVAAIKTDGTLWTWGNGSDGALGNNDTTDAVDTPITTFAGGTNWKQVSSAGAITAAIKTDGTLWFWGNGSVGSLGTNDTINRLTPVTTFAGGTNWKQVSVSVSGSTAAIKTDGTLWTWGDGTYGKLGNATITNTSTPVTTFTGGTNWKQVSSGVRHTTAIKTDGTLWSWGEATVGLLGINLGFPFYDVSTSTPVTTFAGGTNWKQVSAGVFHTAAIKTDGTLWVWGYDVFGGLGVNGASGPYGQPLMLTPVTTFAGGTNWKQVSCSYYSTAAIKSVDF
jgi:alpha-tubulin suppressor-like RCC1 family protein